MAVCDHQTTECKLKVDTVVSPIVCRLNGQVTFNYAVHLKQQFTPKYFLSKADIDKLIFQILKNFHTKT